MRDTIKGIGLAFGLFWCSYGILVGVGWLWHFVHKASAPAPAVVERRVVPVRAVYSAPPVASVVPAPLPQRIPIQPTRLPPDSDGTEESEEAVESPMVSRQSSGGYLPRYVSSERVRVSAPAVVADDEGGDVEEAPARVAYWKRAEAEDSRTLDDFVGGVDPRRGQTIKTGSTAFREDGDMVIVTGSTIHTSRGMWVDTGGVILGPQGQSMLRVGDMIYENGIVKSQKIGGDDGDYYLRNGYSINQSSQTLTDFDE